VKSDNGAQVSKAGDVITYTLTVTNTGNVTLTNVQVNDPLTGLATSVGNLAPAATAVVNTNYTVTQADVDKGSVLNKGLTKGNSPDERTPEDEDDEETPIVRNPSIQIVKSDNGAQVSKAGDVITYTLTVTNTGNVTLTNVQVNDPLTGLATSVGNLAPAATAVVNTNYTVTQADVDKGSVLNKGLTKGNSPDERTPEDEDEVVTPIKQVPGLDISKVADQTEVAAFSEIIYTITITNTGNVNLKDVVILDPLTGLEVKVGDFAPGETRVETTSYFTTFTDAIKGVVTNTATVIGKSNEVEVRDEATATVKVLPPPPAPVNPAIFVEKVANRATVEKGGDVIVYTITVTNIGDVTLNNVLVEDPLTGLKSTIATLTVRESIEFTTAYTVTIADIAAQKPILNTAFASTKYEPTGEEVKEEAKAEVNIACSDDTLITGIVFNAMTGQPLAGVPVTLVPQQSTPGDILIMITGADGRYTFKDFVPGQYLVQVQDANLNAARGLFPVQSSLFFTLIEACKFQTKDFGYETYDGVVLSDFVWYDLNSDGIQNEWFDANDDSKVNLNDPNAGPISIRDWEWFDLNGDGRFDGPENEGELNKAGFGNSRNANISVTGPNNFNSNVIIGVLGYWRIRIDNVVAGDYTARLTLDANLNEQARLIRDTGKVKNLPNPGGRMTDINGIRFEIQCGLTTEDGVTRTISTENRVAFDMDFGIRCLEKAIEILANDDNFGEFFLSYGGVLGNILTNDQLDKAQPLPAAVNINFTDFGGLLGVSVDSNGVLSLIPGLNPVGRYTLKYTLSEKAFPDNKDEAIVIITIINDQVDLSVTKTSFEAEIYEGDEYEYEIVVRNIGGTPATNVTIVDDLPASVTYVSSRVVSVSSGQIQVGQPAFNGNKITWTVPFVPAEGVITLRVKVKAGDAGTVTNLVKVDSEEDDTNLADNQDTDVNQVLPFRIPNVITPNADGDNDTFEIKGLGKFAASEIVILNRYGDHVLEKTNYQNDWNAPGQVAGTYFYVLKLTDRSGKVHEFTGWIQVIKE
jgi:gliding motility-associated-like protein/uncharacterized repeat protein (TIGR01451 family)